MNEEIIPLSDSDLPDGYIALDYIEVTGTQYIETSSKGTQKTRVKCEFMHTAISDGAIYGARNTTSSNNFSFRVIQGNWQPAYIQLLNPEPAIPADHNWHMVDHNKQAFYLDGVKIVESTAASSFNTGYNICIGQIKASAGMYPGCARFRYFQIYEDDVLTVNLVPCISPSCEIGMYDKVEGKFYGNAGTGQFIAGHYTFDLASSIVFSSPESFTITPTGEWEGMLTYSTNTLDWYEVLPDGTISSAIQDNENKIYFRGTGNTVITGSVSNRWIIEGSQVKCRGNIQTLLDYIKVDTKTSFLMGDRSFAGMFSLNSALVSAPELPATELSQKCYMGMFWQCSKLVVPPYELPAQYLTFQCYSDMFAQCSELASAPIIGATKAAEKSCANMFMDCVKLTKAPELLATTLGESCYEDMFMGCTSLLEPPVLPALTMQKNCYNGMFYDCPNLKVYTNKGGAHWIEYRIPQSGPGTSAEGALTDMFKYTGGTVPSTPALNMTYYLERTAPTKKRNVIKPRHGQTEPTIEDLEEYELGYCGGALYIRENDAIVKISGGGGGSAGDMYVDQDELEEMLNGVFGQ